VLPGGQVLGGRRRLAVNDRTTRSKARGPIIQKNMSAVRRWTPTCFSGGTQQLTRLNENE